MKMYICCDISIWRESFVKNKPKLKRILIASAVVSMLLGIIGGVLKVFGSDKSNGDYFLIASVCVTAIFVVLLILVITRKQ